MHVHCTLHPIDSYCSRYQLHWNCLSKWRSGKQSTCQAGNEGSIPGSGRSPVKGHDTPLQYSCLENPMDRGAWRATVHGVTKSQARLSDHVSMHTCPVKYVIFYQWNWSWRKGWANSHPTNWKVTNPSSGNLFAYVHQINSDQDVLMLGGLAQVWLLLRVSCP